MSRSALHVDDLAPNRRSDPVFGIAAGLYLALLLSPAVLLAVSVAGLTDPALLYGTFLATGVGGLALAGLTVGRRPAFAPRLGSSRLTWLPAVLGVAVAVGALAAFEFGGGVSVIGAFLGLFAALCGCLVDALARSRYASAVLAGATEQIAFEAGWPDAARNRLYAVAGIVVGLSLAALVASVVDDPLRTRLLPWSSFERYDRTDDGVVLRRPWRVDVRLATDDLEDPDAVADALARHLGPPA